MKDFVTFMKGMNFVDKKLLYQYLIGWGLWPSQPMRVMSSSVSLHVPKHTFPGQA